MTNRAITQGQLVRWLLAAAVVGLCGGTGEAAPGAAGLLANVRELIGDAACRSDAQCRTVAVGAKACGGPEGYLAWSTSRTDEAALASAVADYSAKRRVEVSASGIASNCALVADPGAYCAQASPAAPDKTPVAAQGCRLRSPSFGGHLRAE